jgi:excisionase family DNA binding protein
MPPAMYGRRLLTLPEVAARYRVSKGTAWRWIQRGYFDAIQLPGGQWRIFEDSCHLPRDGGGEGRGLA